MKTDAYYETVRQLLAEDIGAPVAHRYVYDLTSLAPEESTPAETAREILESHTRRGERDLLALDADDPDDIAWRA
jgi:hypothetical protein